MLILTGDVPFVRDLESLDRAANVCFSHGFDRVSDPDIPHFDRWLIVHCMMALEGKHVHDVELVPDIVVQIQGFVLRLPKMKHNRTPSAHGTGQI